MWIVRILGLVMFSASLAGVEDPFSGTWKLNLSRSELPEPLPKSQTASVRADGTSIRIVEEVVSATGEHMNISVDARFDGKDYPIKGSPFADSVAYQRVDRYTIRGVGKKNGKEVMRETVVVARDGRTLTGTYSGTDATGKQVTAVAVFEKQ
jgi:hypothetical protein